MESILEQWRIHRREIDEILPPPPMLKYDFDNLTGKKYCIFLENLER